MNLEQRVEELEMEVQLLKGQIQTTLLDIHEMLLNRTYPALHAGEPSTTAATAAETPAAPVHRISLAQPLLDEDDEDGTVPDASLFRKVNTIDDLPLPNSAPAYPPAAPDRADWTLANPRDTGVGGWTDAISNPRDASPHDWIELENWVGQKVEQLGINRTRELINLYARQERFTTQECDLLMQFVDIYDDAVPTPSSARHPVSGASANGHAPSAARASGSSARPSIVPQTRAVVNEIRTELRHQNDRSWAQDEALSDQLSEQQGLVLRLIAGILNAGDNPPASNHGRRKR